MEVKEVMQPVMMIGLVILMFCHAVAVGHIHNSYGKINPEEHMNVSQMIKYFGYPCEVHDVITEDGYILTVQRIPYGRRNVKRKNEAVYLQHGLLDSSVTWVVNFPNQSLAFILADEGYDVWLGNVRGNTYGRKNVDYSPHTSQFWDFSFDEMAKYDLPAIVHYILGITRLPDLHYVGHSQGTMIGFIEFGRNKELASKIKGFHALAPVATMNHIKGLFKILSDFAPEFEFVFKIFGTHEFLPSGWIFKFLSDVVCAQSHILEKLCGDIIFIMVGFDQKNLNVQRLPIYTSHTPAGTSVKNIVHYVQMIKSGKFQMYDYGRAGNIKKYNQPTPPLYDVGLMNTPVSVFLGSNDWLADPYDANHSLIPFLQNIIFRKDIQGFNHLDFTWGEHANTLIYEDIIRLMNK